MRQSIRFYLGDRLVSLDDVAPDRTLLDWLRHEGRTGTKEGCNEGDCGACMVIVARRRRAGQGDGQGAGPGAGPGPETAQDPAAQSGQGRAGQGQVGSGQAGQEQSVHGQASIQVQAVNACIQLLPMLDGAALFTIEDIGTQEALHPVQQAMVAFNGAQCGFCTPGFVMSMVAYRNADQNGDDDAAIDSALSGNLCRCTGYAPIIRAMKQALGAPNSAFEDRLAVLDERLAALDDRKDVTVETAQGSVFLPATADSLAGYLVAHPDATIVAGATDVGLWVTKSMRPLPRVAFIGQCADLDFIEESAGGLRIGAAVTYERARAALSRLLPDFGVLIGRIGSTPIRNSATLCGNIANGSPIGDGPPALIAAGATLHLRCGAERRSLPLERYFLAYGKQDRRPGEFVEAVSVPRPAEGMFYRSYKISKRFDQDISAVLAAFALRLDGEGRILDARLAFGGMAAIPCRAAGAEQALTGAVWNEAALEAARTALASDFAPLSDMRASAWYRQTVAANLLTRFFEESRGETMRLAKAGRLAHV